MLNKLTTNLLLGTMLVLGFSAHATQPTKGNYYANATDFKLDPKLPEPFARTAAVQVLVNHDLQDASLVFLMSEAEGIDVTFPIVKDTTDNCNVREITAAPPEGSTPYYKDFEIKVIDYSGNTCDSTKVPAATFATLKSYEVHHKSTTYSTILAEPLKIVPPEHN